MGFKTLNHRLLTLRQARIAYTCAVFNPYGVWTGEVELQLAHFAL